MHPTFRTGFLAGVFVALFSALIFFWHWQPERQLRLHSEHLVRNLQARDWKGVAEFVADDYRDQWSEDRALFLRRVREAMPLLRNVAISAAPAGIEIEEREGSWTSKITLSGGGEFAAAIVERVNSLRAPFVLRWRKQSAKPWDWKLVGVSNPDLDLPPDF